MSDKQLRIWALLGSRVGDNNQVLALAEALGLPFETRTLTYRPWWGILLRLFPAQLLLLDRAARRWIEPPLPDVTIGIGRRSVAVARWLKRRSGGRTRIIRLGNPRARPEEFDLVITTPQYPVPAADNAVVLPLAMNRFRKAPRPTSEEQAWLDALPRPHLLLSLGGTAPMWRLDMDALRTAASSLLDRATRAGGTLIVVGSPRTPAEATQAVREIVGADARAAFVEGAARYPVLLADADEQFVTADSVSMISEAIMSGKPVGLVPIEQDERGRRKLHPDPAKSATRDPRRFWAEVQARGLVGTVDQPRCGKVEDAVETAVAAVRKTLGSLLE